MKITFEMDRPTKNTVLFRETDTEKIKTLYVPKTTLRELGWAEGKALEIEIKVKG